MQNICGSNMSQYNTELTIGNLRVMIYDARYLMTFNANAGMHSHFYYELFYVIDGDAEILCDSGKYFVTRSDLYIFPPSFQHFRVAKEDDVLKCQQVPIRFTYERLNHGEDVYALFDGVFHTKSDILIFRHSTGLRMIFEELLSETRLHARLEKVKMHALITTLVLDVIRFSYPDLEGKPRELDDTVCSRNFIIEDFFSIHYMDSVKIEDLAGRLNLSAKQTGRVLMEMYGMTFRKKLTVTRIQVAKSLLRYSKAPVAEVAESVGYQTLNGFIEAFRCEEGISPAQFRKDCYRELPDEPNLVVY